MTTESGKKIDYSFKPSDFVSKPGPCGNSRLHLTVPTIPSHLPLEKERADQARAALDVCVEIIGLWGERESGKDSPEFQEAAENFREATGVEVLDVIKFASDCVFQGQDF